MWASSGCRPVSCLSHSRCRELAQTFGGPRGGFPSCLKFLPFSSGSVPKVGMVSGLAAVVVAVWYVVSSFRFPVCRRSPVTFVWLADPRQIHVISPYPCGEEEKTQ